MQFKKQRPHHDIPALFAAEKSSAHGFLCVSAPMVRYSKLEFRKLLRMQGVKLCFTPMIIADSFNRSQKARENEFTTSIDDQPLIAQFAACNANEFVKAAQLIYPYVDGIDLNCGCPQTWAIAKGYGCGLLREPEVVRDIMQNIRRTLPTDLSISLKIRLLNGPETVQSTVEFARQMEKCGVTFLTLHGRTARQSSSHPLNVSAIADVKQSLQIPFIANGSVRSWNDACDLYEQTKSDGIMAARGLLANPALFNLTYKDVYKTPIECAQQWLDIAVRAGDKLTFQCFHHHLVFMWSSHMKRKLRNEFSSLSNKEQIFDFFENQFNVQPSSQALAANRFEYTECTYEHVAAQISPSIQQNEVVASWEESTNGKFFTEFNSELDDMKCTNDTKDNSFDLGESFFTEIF